MSQWLSDAEVADPRQFDLDDEGLLRTPAQIRELRRGWADAGPLDWGGFLLRPDAAAIDRRESVAAPDAHGIYGLFLEDRLLYIGKASSLCSRLGQHARNAMMRRAFWFDSFSFCRVPEFALRDIEVAHIHTLTPSRNRLYEPITWPGHCYVQCALLALWAPQAETQGTAPC